MGNVYCTATNSGTAALHMGLAACGVSHGDHVIIPAYTWPSSATCVLHQGGIPIFVDIDFATMNIDAHKIETAITSRTKAIIVVHLHGLAAEMSDILKIASKYNLAVIEDACQAYGTLYKKKKVGTFGDCAAFSLNQHKTLSAGEGGLFLTNDFNKLKLAQQVWSFGEIKELTGKRDYHVYSRGWMYRMNDLTASLALAQLQRLDYYLKVQRENALFLQENIKSLSSQGLIIPIEPLLHCHSWYEYVCRLDMEVIGWKGNPVDFRNRVVEALNAEGVETHVWQKNILPQMVLFRCEDMMNIDIIQDQYPKAMRHLQTHFGINTQLRVPNNKNVIKKIAEAFFKVFENINNL